MAITIRSLNTLRGVATLIVLVSHFTNSAGAWGQVTGKGAGQIGVMLFYILSGFLMALLYWPKEPNGTNLRGYVTARAARVLPLYLIVVIVSFGAGWPYRIETVSDLLSHLLFLQGTSVLWTIPVEIQFYVLFGAFWYLFARRPRITLAVTATALLAVWATDFPRHVFELTAGIVVDTQIIRALPYFIAGCVMGRAYAATGGPMRLASHGFTLGLLLIPLLYPQIFHHLFGHYYILWRSVGAWMILVSAFAVVVFLVPTGNLLLENRVGDFLGRISYSMYLLHLPILHWQRGFSAHLPVLLQLGLFVVLTTIASWVSFTLIEEPARKAIRRLSKPDRAPAPASA